MDDNVDFLFQKPSFKLNERNSYAVATYVQADREYAYQETTP